MQMLQSGLQDIALSSLSLSWPRDHCEDPFASDPWSEDRRNLSPAISFNQGYSFSFAPSGHSSNASQGELPSWSPQRSDDPLHKFRASMQTGELSKLTEQSSSFLSNTTNRKTGSLSSAGSTESVNSQHSPSTTWSAVVQKNPRPMKHKKPKPAKTFTVTLSACCMTPKIRLICTCCNEETFIKVKEEMKPRLIPVSTSQLGFCRFCQTNGDPPEVYQSHSLRSDDGKVTCPVLREYNCPICNNGGGDFAHTIKYCPMARKAKPSN
ncbi:uncharacterized protein LOC100907596 [Galendromus occidentalis]|uniref:Uncharacterized protein LOC100907596 n=1 Tax=Galendromus occidentalis TaxID=34638 RepID=A0AAJ7P911_9ACAR|nr:uncharacterized protein LOC100907596 [Galendromus occidentalis]